MVRWNKVLMWLDSIKDTLHSCERFEPSGHFISRWSMIFRIIIVLNRTVVVCFINNITWHYYIYTNKELLQIHWCWHIDWGFDNLCGSHDFKVGYITSLDCIKKNRLSLIPSTDRIQRTFTLTMTLNSIWLICLWGWHLPRSPKLYYIKLYLILYKTSI